MKTVNISDFRANLLKYLEEANAGEPVSVTTNGKLLATINPPVNKKSLAKQQLKELAVSAKLNDIVAPSGSDWDVLA